MKKNLFLMALAAVAMLATSCQKENGSDADQVADTKLKVRIANVGAKSRAVGDPVAANQIALNDGIIFIMNAKNEVTYQEAIVTSEITGSSGQVLKQQVTKTDKVYIVGNLTTELTAKLTAATNLTLDNINAELLSITSTVGQDYTKVTLANSDAQSAAITVSGSGDNTATVSVNIAPVYSRIELASVKGEAGNQQELTSFDVTGVYVTDYYLQYSLGGSFGGAIYEQKQETNFDSVDGTMKNEGTWSSSNNSGIVAIPETNKSWVYNVPAGALPRLIVKLQNVVGKKNGAEIDNTDPYYLTLTGYTQSNTRITEMKRGKVYRIEALTFKLDQMATKPNDDKVTLTVKVAITDWAIEVVDGVL